MECVHVGVWERAQSVCACVRACAIMMCVRTRVTIQDLLECYAVGAKQTCGPGIIQPHLEPVQSS